MVCRTSLDARTTVARRGSRRRNGRQDPTGMLEVRKKERGVGGGGGGGGGGGTGLLGAHDERDEGLRLGGLRRLVQQHLAEPEVGQARVAAPDARRAHDVRRSQHQLLHACGATTNWRFLC